MGRAGIVLGLEVSRLARNNADWHRLLEICALTVTLICDEDGLYDPGDFNDRLLLGLKGTMSEAELHFLRARLRGGQLSKARRGELRMAPAGRPGLRQRRAGRARPRRRGAAGAPPPVRHLRPHRLGPRRGQPRSGDEHLLFPVADPHRAAQGRAGLDAAAPLAGAAHPAQPALCRRVLSTAAAAKRSRANGKTTFQALPREQWTALIPDAHPGYITWDSLRGQPAATARQRRRPRRRPAPPARPAKAPRCCRAWPSAAAAGGG